MNKYLVINLTKCKIYTVTTTKYFKEIKDLNAWKDNLFYGLEY